jgi:hypothetical protein
LLIEKHPKLIGKKFGAKAREAGEPAAEPKGAPKKQRAKKNDEHKELQREPQSENEQKEDAKEVKPKSSRGRPQKNPPAAKDSQTAAPKEKEAAAQIPAAKGVESGVPEEPKEQKAAIPPGPLTFPSYAMALPPFSQRKPRNDPNPEGVLLSLFSVPAEDRGKPLGCERPKHQDPSFFAPSLWEFQTNAQVTLGTPHASRKGGASRRWSGTSWEPLR